MAGIKKKTLATEKKKTLAFDMSTTNVRNFHENGRVE